MANHHFRKKSLVLTSCCIFALFLILVMSCSGLPGADPTFTPEPPELEILSPSPESEFSLGPNEKILANGTHNLSSDDFVWIFLKDIYGHYYLQNPDIDLVDDGTWEATNIRPLKEIRYIIAVYVNSDGHKRIQEWANAGRWGGITEDEIKSLEGYLELDRVKIITPGVSDY